MFMFGKFGKNVIKLPNIFLPIIHEFPIILVFYILIRYSIYEVWNREANEIISSIAVWVFYPYFIAATIFLSKKSWLRWFWYVFLFSIFGFSIFLYNNFNMFVDPTVFRLIGETNLSESEGFLREYLFSRNSMMTFLKLLLYVVIAICIELAYRRYILKNIKVSSINPFAFALFSICLCYGAYSCKAYMDYIKLLMNRDTVDYDHGYYPALDWYSRFLYSPCIVFASNGDFKKAIRSSLAVHNVNTFFDKNDSLNIVFVIGESYIKSHAHFYGDNLNTTPVLSKEKERGNLYVFNDAVSPFNYTSTALRNMLSCNSIGHSEKWYNYPYFPLLFKRAGYDVYFWDNQHEWGVGEVCVFSLNQYLHDENLSKETYTKTNAISFEFDGQLVEDFKNKVVMSRPNNLIMFHLLGQHFKADMRFPHTKEFIHFTTDSIKRNETWLNKEKLQLIADYENATYYNDFVLGQILNVFRDKNAVLIYVSDHGEEVYDYRDHLGRTYGKIDKLQLTYQYDIPFVIWCSDKFKQKYHDVVTAINESTNKPFMSDNICQLFFHLGRIQTNFYHEDRDLLSPMYKCEKRLISESEIEYTSIN